MYELDLRCRYMFHYLVRNDLIVLCMCDAKFDPAVAFTFLDDVATRFLQCYDRKVS